MNRLKKAQIYFLVTNVLLLIYQYMLVINNYGIEDEKQDCGDYFISKSGQQYWNSIIHFIARFFMSHPGAISALVLFWKKRSELKPGQFRN